jgi:hypothetical protein
MRLGFVLLKNVVDANRFLESKEVESTAGNPVTVYLRLVDLDQPDPLKGEGHLRYLPVVGATLAALFNNLNDALKINRFPVQPFPNDDRSIWSFQLLAGETVAPNSLEVRLTESGVTSLLVPDARFVSSPINKPFC